MAEAMGLPLLQPRRPSARLKQTGRSFAGGLRFPLVSFVCSFSSPLRVTPSHCATISCHPWLMLWASSIVQGNWWGFPRRSVRITKWSLQYRLRLSRCRCACEVSSEVQARCWSRIVCCFILQSCSTCAWYWANVAAPLFCIVCIWLANARHHKKNGLQRHEPIREHKYPARKADVTQSSARVGSRTALSLGRSTGGRSAPHQVRAIR